MRVELKLHPYSICPAVSRIEVDVSRKPDGALALSYLVTGDIAALRIPQPEALARSDGLWQHTCFEAFVRGSGAAYREFNFAPSTQWAAYDFTGYREGMAEAPIVPPVIETSTAGGRFELRASIAPGGAAVGLGLSAVIEEASGRKSWWALAHPPGRPDFHHGDCFALELPAAERR